MKNINKNEKILIISPHPDDDVLGCGGIMAKYGPQCDVMCINSSGFQAPYEQCADTRIKEFHNVMDFYNVHKRWIWKIFGPAPNIDQIRTNESEYLNTTDFSQYSRVFIPCRYDEHVEHAFIANNLVPKMLTRASHECLIYEYMVWGKVKVKPNCSFIINPYKKKKALRLYKSRNQQVLMKLAKLDGFLPCFHEHFICTPIKKWKPNDYANIQK